DQVERSLETWCRAIQPLPEPLCDQIHSLSEEALDIQRDLALERRRTRYTPEDYDSAQLRWLEEALKESAEERPNNWRVVYLHHPLYTSILNHCERADIADTRENLLPLLRDRVHLILSGHAHAFEWFRSDALPNAGIFVTGGGGQITLRPSILVPSRLPRHRGEYE